jgi:hypothetical protein
MSTNTLLTLALAGALMLSGCATTAWQPPVHHPADPGAPAGASVPITALERYRSDTTPAETPPPSTLDDDGGHHHHHHQEAQP